jgi:hypothetical protein
MYLTYSTVDKPKHHGKHEKKILAETYVGSIIAGELPFPLRFGRVRNGVGFSGMPGAPLARQGRKYLGSKTGSIS